MQQHKTLLTKKVLPLIAAMVLPSVAQAGQTEAPMAPAPQSDCEAGWTLGMEAMALRPFQSEGGYDEDGYDFGGRLSLGYQFNDCLFTKVTFFGYKTDTFDERGTFFHDQGDLEVSYLDAVVGQHFRPSDKLTLSPYAGLRWATFDEGIDLLDDGEGVSRYTEDHEFSGLGIVVGIDGVRALGAGFSLYGTAKQSVVFGSSDNSFRDTFQGQTRDSASESDDRVVSITELGLGVQYDFGFSGIAANIRAGVEGQWWGGLSGASGDGFDDSDQGGDSENTGLAGFVLGANFRF